MSVSFRSIAIVGAGAVGGYYGARLAQHGHDVHFFLRSDYQAVRDHGWTIKSRDGDFTLPPGQVHAYHSPAQMPQVDLVVVTLKTTANDQFHELIEPLLHENTSILTLQNGLGNEQQLADLFGPQRVLGGLAFTCINRIGPGQIHHMDHGLIRLGEFNGGPSERAAAIAKLFNDSQIHCQVLDNLRYGRWEKLVWNIPFNGLGAAMDLSTDQLIATPNGVKLVADLMAEVLRVAKSDGINLPDGIIETKIEQTHSMGTYYSSMQIDRRERRPLEIEAIVGKPLGVATINHVGCPLMASLYRLLSLIC
jgi:2-dehydropantoate 2-reductase